MDQRLERIYELLGEVLKEREPESAARDGWYDPPMPPIEIGSTLSATDLLSWWFRPPSRSRDTWDSYFGEPRAAVRAEDVPARPSQSPPPSSTSNRARELAGHAALEALFGTAEEEELAAEDADRAVQVLYAFLHALGEGDVERCLGCVADDYHVLEEDREIDRDRLREQLEGLLASLDGWDYELTLASVPQPVRHPYGILIYVEVSIDATRAADHARRGLIERRVVFLERNTDGDWMIAGLSRPRP